MQMNNSNQQSWKYSRKFKHVLPISIHPLYTVELEFSDKIILPRSVGQDLVRNRLPFPPQFIVTPERSFHNSVYCTALDFSAEEGFVYLPFWMLRELGYKVLSTQKGTQRSTKAGYGVTLSILSTYFWKNKLMYTIKRCMKVEYYTDSVISQEILREQLIKYLFVRELSEVSVTINDKLIILKIIKVIPGPLAIIEGDFSLIQITNLPKSSQATKEISINTESNFLSEPIPPTHKLPKFLVSIIHKKSKNATIAPIFSDEDLIKSKTQIKHRKNHSEIPIDIQKLLNSRVSTPEFVEKPRRNEHIKDKLESNDNDLGKSLEDSQKILPPVYHTPEITNAKRMCSITITDHKNPAKKKLSSTLIQFESLKKRAATPVVLKTIKIDANLPFSTRGHSNHYNYLKIHNY